MFALELVGWLTNKIDNLKTEDSLLLSPSGYIKLMSKETSDLCSVSSFSTQWVWYRILLTAFEWAGLPNLCRDGFSLRRGLCYFNLRFLFIVSLKV